MTRRPALRQTDLQSAIDVMQKSNLLPRALDILPNGTHRWHFTQPADSDDDALETELAAFRAKHGYD